MTYLSIASVARVAYEAVRALGVALEQAQSTPFDALEAEVRYAVVDLALQIVCSPATTLSEFRVYLREAEAERALPAMIGAELLEAELFFTIVRQLGVR